MVWAMENRTAMGAEPRAYREDAEAVGCEVANIVLKMALG